MKKLLALLLTLGLVIACVPALGEELKYATVEDGPLGRYAEPITITFIKQVNSSQNDHMNELNTLYGETWEDNRWTRLFKDELNIDVEYLWIVDDSQFAQKWRLSMASGDLPDVIVSGLMDLSQLVEADMVQEMGPVWDAYASDMAKGFVDMIGQSWIDGITFDGKVMAVPGYAAPYDYCRYLWIRTDWMEKLGLEAPKTLDDLWAMWEAFVTQDPDGNGVDDTYGHRPPLSVSAAHILMDKAPSCTLE